MFVEEVSVKSKTKHTFKYDYFPGFLLYLKYIMHYNLHTTETSKKAENSLRLPPLQNNNFSKYVI